MWREQEPIVFWLGKHRLAVRGIVDRWFAPTQHWLKVNAEDDQIYVLPHDETSRHWKLTALIRQDG